jgi:glycosyltransferase involved in cell wall biosynthesis
MQMIPSTERTTTPVSVSIVTPCYNGARFLEQTLRSAAEQSRPPLEIIVIDDGSTDDSAAIAAAFGPPVRLLQQTNHGESSARNKGLAEALGSHVLFLDADDLLGPDALFQLSDAVKNDPGAVALMGCARFNTDPADPFLITMPEYDRFLPDIIDTNFGPPHTWMAPTDVVRAAGGFYDALQWSEDWDILWRVGLHASGLVPVDYVGAFYRQHSGSQFANTSLANRARGQAILKARMGEELLRRPDLLDEHGERLLWGCWTALKNARDRGVGWDELQPLCSVLTRLATSGPASVTRRKFTTLIRVIGVRPAFTLQTLAPLAQRAGART